MNGNGKALVLRLPRWWPTSKERLRRSESDMAPYRRLALQLHYGSSRSDDPRSVLLVTPTTSILGARGSAHLTCSLAEQLGRHVLLADASSRDPEISRILDCTGDRGFADALSDPNLSLNDLVLGTDRDNISFLPAGAGPGSSQLASPDDINVLLEAAVRRYEFVVLSGGSLLNDPMAIALAPHVGCVLLLVIENETMVEDLDAAQDALSFCKARKVGLVLTTPESRGWWSP